jgi:ATP-dependent helicase Lhr and Lhr-like helicase
LSSSAAYELLHTRVQRWCWGQGWSGLREVQEGAVKPILAGDRDVILAAATAAGKTEAAFLPITSRLLDDPRESVQVLCLSPLKALINDQFLRLEELCGGVGVEVHRWHGDVGSGKKRALLENPRGVLLITPESLEALFVLRGTRLAGLFEHLAYVVVDELHSFIGGERGRQLQSLLHRLELVLRRRVPRVGLSATLGDMDLARSFLRGEDPRRVELVEGDAGEHELQLQLRGVCEYSSDSGEAAIAQHLFEVLRGDDHLVFAGSRRAVESYAARLGDLCDQRRLPREFFPHHGSLSKVLREEVEDALRRGNTPRTVICTSTLEMGMDLGDIVSVAQLGPPPSVAALRQRLGRSGRRGAPSILRLYTAERTVDGTTPVQDRLREELVQAVACCELMLEGWCEPPPAEALHLSTLIQQVLSVIAQHSGARADQLHSALCEHGPWRDVDSATFADLLRSLAEHELVSQDARGELLTGAVGERLVEDWHFFAAFATAEEYRVLVDGKELGTIPVETAIVVGSGLIFGGRRWHVLEVDENRREIRVTPGGQGQPPLFLGHGGEVHDVVRARMRAVLAGSGPPRYLDSGARELLAEARDTFAELGLARTQVIEEDGDALLLLWAGDRVQSTVSVALARIGRRVSTDGMVLRAENCSAKKLWSALGDLEADGVGDPLELAASVAIRRGAKYDEFLSDELLALDYASRALDVPGALGAIRAALEGA